MQDFTVSTMPPALIRLLRAFALMARVYLKCGCISWNTCMANCTRASAMHRNETMLLGHNVSLIGGIETIDAVLHMIQGLYKVL